MYLPDWVEVLIIILFVILLFFGAFYGAIEFNEKSCMSKADMMGVNHRFDVWTGCMIEIKTGQWIPLDSYYWKDDAK